MKNIKSYQRLLVGLVLFTVSVLLEYFNRHTTFIYARFYYIKGRDFLSETNTTTEGSDSHNKWSVPRREDVWIDLSKSRNVSRKPTNLSFVKTTTKMIAAKTILIYTPFWDSRPWPLAVPSWDGRAMGSNDYKINKYCPHVCRLTYNRKEFSKSHAVVFHGMDMPGIKELQELNSRRLSFQRWVFFIHESPINTFLDLKALQFMFNWTMTYRLDSDIFHPYFYFHPIPHPFKSEESVLHEINYAEGKDRFVSWRVSNCGSKIRNDIVKKLLEVVPIDIYGRCQSHFGQSGHACPVDTIECSLTMRRYKFYIVFENSNCYHYVTEKYWANALFMGIVPIIMGGAVLEEKLMIPRTYINILDFKNARSLAEYLKYLDKNDTAYNEFFWYKKHYKIFKPLQSCQLCRKLHEENQKPKVTDLFSYWNRDTNCYINESYIRNNWLK